MKKVSNIISKARVSRGILLAFLLLLISSGSYTFSGSIIPDIPLSNNHSLLKWTYKSSFFGLAPSDLEYIVKTSEIPVRKSFENPIVIAKKGSLSIDVMANYLHFNNPALSLKKSKEIASLYYEEANIEGINHDVAFSQMCLETGFLSFGGDVHPDQNNFCGLGVTGNGVKGLSFEDEKNGIRAHIQHLKAYASTQNLNNELVDSRFNFVKRGSAKNVDELTGKWAADKNYGKKIKNILRRLESFN